MAQARITYEWWETMHDEADREIKFSVELKVYLSRDLGSANEAPSWSMDWDFAAPAAQHGLTESQIEKILRDDTHDAQILFMALEEYND